MKTKIRLRVQAAALWGAVGGVLLVLGCGNADPNAFLEGNGHLTADRGDATDTATDGIESDTAPDDACAAIEWGLGCKTDAPTYNITFDGLNVSKNSKETVSLESLYCDGYESVVLVMGDADCVVCPGWYRTLGEYTKEIHERNAVIVSACTDSFGLETLADEVALSITEDLNPDYVTGESPFKYPCRYEFTPFTMVVDLSNATILGKDSALHQLTPENILSLLDDAAED